MKIIYFFLLSVIYINGNCQSTRQKHKKTNHTKTYKSNVAGKTLNNATGDTIVTALPRQTITEKYLNGTSGTDAKTHVAESTTNNSAFAGGVHAAANAGEKFDSATNLNPNSANTNVSTNTASNTNSTLVNDTVFNNNTITTNGVTTNGVTTNSGAVDRSGQAQFGQTNWGNSRSTVGESQWTIPPPVSASFTKEFPAAGNLTWTRNNTDTSIYSARYKSGDAWVTTNYNVSGQRVDMRTEMPLTLLPQPVSAYIGKLPTNLQISTVSKWQVYGKPDVYEIGTRTGKTFYVNSEGTEIKR